jgi:hypothetical protein
VSALITLPVVYRLNPQTALGGLVAASALMTVIGLVVLALTDPGIGAAIPRF